MENKNTSLIKVEEPKFDLPTSRRESIRWSRCYENMKSNIGNTIDLMASDYNIEQAGRSIGIKLLCCW